MAAGDLRELASYLVHCSANSLGEFYVQRLGRASHLERDLRDVARELVATLAMVDLADLLRNHGEEIIASASAVRQPILIERDAAPAKWKAAHYGAGNFFDLIHAPEAMLSPIDKLVLIVICITIPESHSYSKSWDWDDLGRLCSVSGEYARSIVGDLIWRQILKRHGAGKTSRFEYIVCPQSDWQDRTHSKPIAGKKGFQPKAKRQRRAAIRVNVRERGQSEVWGERCGYFPKTPFGGEIVVQLTTGTRRTTVRPLPGPLELRYREGSPTETEELVAGNQDSPSTQLVAGNQLAPPEPKSAPSETQLVAGKHSGSSTPLVAGNQDSPSTQLVAGNQLAPPEPKSAPSETQLVAGKHSGSSTPLVAGNQLVGREMIRTPIPVWEGKIWVIHPKGENPYTPREKRNMVKKYGGAPRAEDLVVYLKAKSYEAEMELRPDWKGWPAAKPKAPPMRKYLCKDCGKRFEDLYGRTLVDECDACFEELRKRLEHKTVARGAPEPGKAFAQQFQAGKLVRGGTCK